LNNQPYPARHMPPLPVDLNQYASRLRELARITACERCEIPLASAMTDTARLLDQVRQLYTALRAERLRAANLEAAIRAALGAYDDGEADPLAYLRDEIPGYAGGDAYGA
jgi:hypothetical protein